MVAEFLAPISTHVLTRGGLGVTSAADLLGESGVGLPDEGAAGTVEAEWAAGPCRG